MSSLRTSACKVCWLWAGESTYKAARVIGCGADARSQRGSSFDGFPMQGSWAGCYVAVP